MQRIGAYHTMKSEKRICFYSNYSPLRKGVERITEFEDVKIIANSIKLIANFMEV